MMIINKNIHSEGIKISIKTLFGNMALQLSIHYKYI
jgi:hypothetical protein